MRHVRRSLRCALLLSVFASVPAWADDVSGRWHGQVEAISAHGDTTGRGDAIDPEALADALHNGRLHGAGLDVTEPEPLPAESPLWDEPHCLIAPHVAGGNHLEKTSEHIIRIALTNVSRYAKQQELLNLVRY